MIEYRFRHSRGYNYYIRQFDSSEDNVGHVASISRKVLVGDLLSYFDREGVSQKEIAFYAAFIVATIEANATEETTMFDNAWDVEYGTEFFARREPKPILWRCLNPRCRGYEWKSSPRHTMGCPKCRKDKIEKVTKTVTVVSDREPREETSVSQMRLELAQPETSDGMREKASE